MTGWIWTGVVVGFDDMRIDCLAMKHCEGYLY